MRLRISQRGSHLPLRQTGKTRPAGHPTLFFAKGRKINIPGMRYANKADLVRTLAKNLNVPEKTAHRVINQFEKTLMQLVAEYGGISWKGVVSIFRYLRPGRPYMQPLTGERIEKIDQEVVRAKIAEVFIAQVLAATKK